MLLRQPQRRRPPACPPEMKDPSGGTTGRVKAIWGAWGGWALAPNIAMGRNYPLPHILVAEGLAHVQNGRRFFLTLRKPVFGGGDTYCPAVHRLSPESDFSDAMVATGGSSARVPGNSFGSKAFSPVFIARVAASLGGADTASGVGVSVTARTAA